MKVATAITTATICALAITLGGCAMFHKEFPADAQYDDLHGLMHAMDEPHMQSMSQELSHARRGAKGVGLLAAQLDKEGVAIDEDDYRRFAIQLQDANKALQEGLADSANFNEVGDLMAAQIQSCTDCHRAYR